MYKKKCIGFVAHRYDLPLTDLCLPPLSDPCPLAALLDYGRHCV